MIGVGKAKAAGVVLAVSMAWSAGAGECRPTLVSADMVTHLLNGQQRVNFSSLPDHGEAWVEALVERARGVGVSDRDHVPRAREVVDANRWIQTITENWASRGESFVWSPPGQAALGWARRVRHSRILAVDRLGGGTNGVVKVTLADEQGEKFQAIFKPLSQSKPVGDRYFEVNPKDFLRFLFHVREIRAPSIYGRILESYWRHGGKAPIHLPDTIEVVLVHQGKSYGVGSLQQWSLGIEVESVRRQDPTRVAYWRGTKAWQEMEAVVRVLDYLFGNSDRFPKKEGEEAIKNLFVEMRSEGGREFLTRANLIDNGLGVPGHLDFTVNQAPTAADVPPALVRALHEVIQLRSKIRQEEGPFFPSWALDDLFRRWEELLQRYPARP